MKFHIEIDCDGAAFAEWPCGDSDAEIAVILRHVSYHVTHNAKPTSWPLLDTWGNTVGRAWMEE